MFSTAGKPLAAILGVFTPSGHAASCPGGYLVSVDSGLMFWLSASTESATRSHSAESVEIYALFLVNTSAYMAAAIYWFRRLESMVRVAPHGED